MNDVTPPTLRLTSRVVALGKPLRIAATDAGAGVDEGSIVALVDGRPVRVSYRRGTISVSTGGLSAGTHRLRVRASDYQEAKNTENVARILPNTRTLTVTFRVR